MNGRQCNEHVTFTLKQNLGPLGLKSPVREYVSVICQGETPDHNRVVVASSRRSGVGLT